MCFIFFCFFFVFLVFFQAEDGIRDLVRSRGLGDVYKRQGEAFAVVAESGQVRAVLDEDRAVDLTSHAAQHVDVAAPHACLLYTSDAADERSSVDLGGRRIIKKKNRARQQQTVQHEQREKNRRLT